MYLNDLCTIPSNLAGNASASFPVGLAPEDGLPVGLQVMAPPLADDRLYRGCRPRARFAGVGRLTSGQDAGMDGGRMTDSARVEPCRRPAQPAPAQGWARRSAGHRPVRGGGRRLRPGAGPGSARRAQHRLQDVLWLLHDVRRGAEHPGMSDMPRATGVAAGGERGRRRVGDPDRPGSQLLDCRLVPVRPEELLLSGYAEELSDLPVRRAHRPRRMDRGGPRRRHLPDRYRARYMEEDTGKSMHIGGATAGSTAPTTRCWTTTGPEFR